MEVQFIGQGLSSPNDKPAGDIINDVLCKDSYQEFSAFVAFVSEGGINQILPNLKKFIERGDTVRLYIGVDLHGTSKEALELLISENIPSFIVYSPNRVVYHPKIYTFEGNSHFFVIVGSSNLTASGLYQNVEASICVSNEYQDDGSGRELLSDIFDYFNAFINGESTTCQPLTQEILDTLVKAKVVLPEKTIREFTNAHVGEISTAQLSDKEELDRTFKKLKVRSPKGKIKRKVRNEIFETGAEDIMVHTSSAEISGTSMWIETKKMTGGSRNILDLSAEGKRDHIKKPGSVEFFGIDKDNHSSRKDIDLIYNGKKYKNNAIFYAEGNSNWRLRINGEAEDGTKMTNYSLPKLGDWGGFQYKILVFEKTETADTYNLYILDESEMDNMIALSEDWAKGGRVQGRAYGFINSISD